jgi:hypothetical protein
MRLLFLLDQTCFCFSSDGSIKENVPEGEDALGGSSSKQKKEQKKSKNESDQEETTDAWGFEKPSASGIPQTLKKGQKKHSSVLG